MIYSNRFAGTPSSGHNPGVKDASSNRIRNVPLPGGIISCVSRRPAYG